MKVFVENEAGSNQKNIFDEKTLEYIKTVTLSRKYPFPYGFILDTTSGDGDNLDCFVITKRDIKSGTTVEVEPIGVLEQIENDKQDHNILAKFSDEEIELTEEHKEIFRERLAHAFDHLENKKIEVGKFLDKKAAEKIIEESR